MYPPIKTAHDAIIRSHNFKIHPINKLSGSRHAVYNNADSTLYVSPAMFSFMITKDDPPQLAPGFLEFLDKIPTIEVDTFTCPSLS